jgi:hypothetical protein
VVKATFVEALCKILPREFPSTDHPNDLFGFLVQIGDGYPGGQNRVVRMHRCHRGCHLGGQVVQLDGGDALVDATGRFLRDLGLNDREISCNPVLILL